MTPAKGRSMRDRPERLNFPPTCMFDMVLKTVDWWTERETQQGMKNYPHFEHIPLTLWRQSLNIVIIQLERGIATLATEPYHVIGVVVDFGADLTQRQVTGTHIVAHEYVALDDLQFHVVLGGGTFDAQQHSIRFCGYETQCNVILFRIGLGIFGEGVLDDALVVAKLIGN